MRCAGRVRTIAIAMPAAALSGLLSVFTFAGHLSAQSSPASPAAERPALRPTDHVRVPPDLSQLWLAPVKGRSRPAGFDEFAAAIKLQADGNVGKSLPLLSSPAMQRGLLAPYAEYYKGIAELKLIRPHEALATFQALQAKSLNGYLVEAAALREAEADETLGDQAAALAVYERLAATKTTAPDDVWMRVAKAARAVGDQEKARNAYARIYYEFPFSELATAAASELDSGAPIAAGSNRYKLELGRAERLFGAKRYGPARTAFEAVKNASQGDDRELVSLRLAECDYFLKRARNARDGLRPYVEHASRQAEALFFYALSLGDLGDQDQYLKTIRRVVTEFPGQSWAEEALNNLGTHYIRVDEDEQADQTFRELYEKYPTSRHAERAAWKIGWRSYKAEQYRDVVRVFERAAVDFPRSDYRPAWVYWAGRAHEELGEAAPAQASFNVAVLDYLNSYYGRLAAKRLGPRVPERRLTLARDTASVDEPGDGPTVPPTATTIRALLSVKLYDQALDELRYAQKVWGDSPAIQATIAWIYQQMGQTETGTQQFNHYRGAITIMRRAYPQFMAAGGEALPRELQRIIYPIGYWDLIKKYSSENELDPYFVAALTLQESTFVPNIESPAKAVGLMQLEAPTARQYAKRLGMKYTASTRTNPETNIRIGTAYLADQVRRFGDLHLVLASYNAGEGNVRRWAAERPGLTAEMFIDDIPFPETANYVRKILGMADDYRRLYGPNATVGDGEELPAAKAAAAARVASAAPSSGTKKKAAAKPAKKRRHTA